MPRREGDLSRRGGGREGGGDDYDDEDAADEECAGGRGEGAKAVVRNSGRWDQLSRTGRDGTESVSRAAAAASAAGHLCSSLQSARSSQGSTFSPPPSPPPPHTPPPLPPKLPVRSQVSRDRSQTYNTGRWRGQFFIIESSWSIYGNAVYKMDAIILGGYLGHSLNINT